MRRWFRVGAAAVLAAGWAIGAVAEKAPTSQPAATSRPAMPPAERFACGSVLRINDDLNEPSGIVFHPTRRTLFAVGDEGDLMELTTDGKTLRHGHIVKGWRDLEGVTVDPATGLLYVAAEGDERILEVDPDRFLVRREFQIPREFGGRTVMKAGGQGIEAITFVPDAGHPQGGTFFVANQCFHLSLTEDGSAIFQVEAPLKSAGGGQAKILRAIEPGVTDLAGLHYDAATGRLLVLSDANDLLMEMKPSGQITRAWSRVPGANQEGFTLDPDGNAYVAQDSGGILKMQWRRPDAGGTKRGD